MNEWPTDEDFEAHGRGAATPDEAARGDIPEEYSPALFVDCDPSGEFATVLLATNGPDDPYPYEEFCCRIDGRWYSHSGSNGNTQFVVQNRFSLFTSWDAAPPGSSMVRVAFQGRTYDCPVRAGYYRLTVWDWDEELYTRRLDELGTLQLKQAKVIREGDRSRIELDITKLTEGERRLWDEHGTDSYPRIVEVIR